MSGQRVLIVDDDARIGAALRAYFERDGFEVELVADGQAAIDAVVARPPDLLLLDLNLPEIDGLDVCRHVRASRPVPIVMISARSTLDDKLRGLNLGADDYITKPFSPREVVARVRAVLRRAMPDADGEESFGSLTLDRRERRASIAGTRVDLTSTEWRLLETLSATPRVTLTRSQLVERALGFDYRGTDRTIDTHVTNLRRKLGAAGTCIVTVFGIGYTFEPPV